MLFFSFNCFLHTKQLFHYANKLWKEKCPQLFSPTNFSKPNPRFFPIHISHHISPSPLVPSPSKALGRVLQHGQHAHRGGRVAERWGLWGRRARELGAVPSGQRPLQHAEPRPGMDGMGWDVVLGPLGFWTLHFAHFFIQGKTSQQRFLVVTLALLVANLLVVVNSDP